MICVWFQYGSRHKQGLILFRAVLSFGTACITFFFEVAKKSRREVKLTWLYRGTDKRSLSRRNGYACNLKVIYPTCAFPVVGTRTRCCCKPE